MENILSVVPGSAYLCYGKGGRAIGSNKTGVGDLSFVFLSQVKFQNR